MDRLKETADEMQAEIVKEARGTYTEGVVDRWVNPRNWGVVEKPDGFAKITGPCGDTMQITIKVEAGRISEVRFVTDGCGTSIASGSMATELAQEKTLEEARNISQDEILDALGGLPWESEHCALLASTVLHAAIRNYSESKKEKE